MVNNDSPSLRFGWTTGACATAALRAALQQMATGHWPENVTITLPRGQTPTFDVQPLDSGKGWAKAGIIKDAGDDPDVTHGALICVRAEQAGQGVGFHAGDGVGIVTKAGLPVAVGEAAINPVPRQMMIEVVDEMAAEHGIGRDISITVSIPGGKEIAGKTWNPRLGIKGGLSILGTTGIVRPFSCSAWIASIHRGIDVARAEGMSHVAGCTGSTSERVVRELYDLSEGAMLDMGDFAGGLLKYLRKNPVERLTIGGGLGKLTKLSQGATDLHSARSQIDFSALAVLSGNADVAGANTILEALDIAGPKIAKIISDNAHARVLDVLGPDTGIAVDIVAITRNGEIVGRSGP